MQQFRLARVPMVQRTKCLELQIQLQNELGVLEWVHYCVVVSRQQAIELVAEKNPELLDQARLDLMFEAPLDGCGDPQYQVRIAKHLLNWRGSQRSVAQAIQAEPERQYPQLEYQIKIPADSEVM